MFSTNKIRSIFMVVIAFLLVSCATVLTGTSQKIYVKVVDEATKNLLSNVSCTVNDRNGGSYRINSNPAMIMVTKGQGVIQIDCRKAGFRQVNMAVGDSFNALTVVNVLFWPGFIIDAVSGAYKKYPSHFMINMEKI